MENRTALAVALVATAAAIALVTVDLMWNLEARLQVDGAGEWVTVSEGEGRDHYYEPLSPYGSHCASGDLRLVVENNRPWGADVEILGSYWERDTGAQVTFLEDTWTLGSFSARSLVFAPPPDLFKEPEGEGDGAALRFPHSLEVRVDDMYLSACVEVPQ